jgi:DNA-binding NarL/FixJ family response regulator
MAHTPHATPRRTALAAPTDLDVTLIRHLATGHTLLTAATTTSISFHAAKRRMDNLRAARHLPPTSAATVAWASRVGFLDGLDLGCRREVTLTGRQRDVLRLLPEGLSVRQIGRRLAVTENTAKTHLQLAYDAIDARTSAHAVALDWRFGYSRLPGGEQR